MYIKELPIWLGTNISPNQGDTESFELVSNSHFGFLEQKNIKSTERFASPIGDIHISRILNMIGKKEYKNSLEIGVGANCVVQVLKDKVDIECQSIVNPTLDNSNNFEKIEVYRETYPSKHLKDKKFDLIYSLNLFEHIPNPEKLLTQIREDLTDDGIAIFIFPIIEYSFKIGDIGVLRHEDVNYFSFNSAINLFESCGFKVDDLINTQGNITIKVSKSESKPIKNNTLNSGNILLENVNKMQEKVNRNKSLIKTLSKQGYSIGFHGANSALSNFLYLANLNTDRHYSIFDADVKKKGKYLPFSFIQIKHSSDPTYSEMDYIFIAASTASEAIRQSAKGKIKEENIIDLFSLDT